MTRPFQEDREAAPGPARAGSPEADVTSLATAIAATADDSLARRLRQRLDQLTKPVGALGRLEDLALRIGLIQASEQPVVTAPRVLLFAADHGVAARGVSAYPRDVTAQMVANLVQGGAAINVLCRQHDLALTIIDVGVVPGPALPVAASETPGLVYRREPLAAGTADLVEGPAMTADQCRRALAIGQAAVAAHPGDALLLGEMGIGNTSSAALLTAWCTGAPLSACIGRGTGLDDAGLSRKQAILSEAWERHRGITEPLAALAAMGGFELAAMAGAMLEAGRRRQLIVVDGFVVTAALLLAWRLAPALADYCVLAHRSHETGHRVAVEALGLSPLLDLELRLGEGSGAALAWPLVRSSLALLDEMATFASAGVATREDS